MPILLTGSRRILILSLLVMASFCLEGCAGRSVAGSLRAQSLGSKPVVLPGDYVAAFYWHDPNQGTSFMLSDVPIDDVLSGKVHQGQILHIELLWLPKPGETPMDSSAADASIRYVVIANGEVGVYGGAGFLMPGGSLDGKTVSLALRDSSLQLVQSTPGFVDLLSPGQLIGNFTATKDEAKTRQLNYAVSQLVTNALGHTQYVNGDVNGGVESPAAHDRQLWAIMR